MAACAHCGSGMDMDCGECKPCPAGDTTDHDSCNRCWRTMVAEAKVRKCQAVLQMGKDMSLSEVGGCEVVCALDDALKDITREGQ